MIVQQRTVKNSELMERFDISVETVRRDLEYLEKQGILRRVYGGAVLNSYLSGEPEYASRVKLHREQRLAIAAKAAEMVEENDCIFMGVGITVQFMAQFLKGKGRLTVFTNALRTAAELSEIPDCSVILPGGSLRPSELTLSGFPAEENFEHFHVDKAFIGIGGATEDCISDYHIAEARLHRRLIETARQAIVLSDSTKLGQQAMTKVCDPGEIDVLITDSGAPKELLRAYEKLGVQVIMAKEET